MDQNKSKCTPHTNANDIIKSEECGCNRSQVKSGKFVKTSLAIQRQEMWPHTTVSKKYAKRSTFDNLEFDAFVAGETKIIGNLLASGEPAVGRIKVLSLVAHWMCRTKNWPVVWGLYESIIEEVEMGEKEWDDDFSGHETMLSTWQISNDSSSTGMDRGRKEIYWCKAYQGGTCDSPTPHIAQIKLDEPTVPVLHICAFCWTNGKRRKEHAEQDCPAKSSLCTQGWGSSKQ